MFAKILVAFVLLVVGLSFGETSARWKLPNKKIIETTNEEKFTGGDSGEYRRQMSLQDDVKNGSGDHNPPLIGTASDFTSSPVNIMDFSGYKDDQRKQSKSQNQGNQTTSDAPPPTVIERLASSRDRLISAGTGNADPAARDVLSSERTSANASHRSRRQIGSGFERIPPLPGDLFGAEKRHPGSHQSGSSVRSRVAAGMRYAGIGKRNTINARSRVDAGMRYMGIGKREY